MQSVTLKPCHVGGGSLGRHYLACRWLLLPLALIDPAFDRPMNTDSDEWNCMNSTFLPLPLGPRHSMDVSVANVILKQQQHAGC